MKKVLALIFCTLISTPSFGHGDHEHGTVFYQLGIPISVNQAKEFSLHVVVRAVRAGKLEESWMDAAIVEAITRQNDEGKEWLVSIHNPQEKRNEKQTIFVYLDEWGNPFEVNFTGE